MMIKKNSLGSVLLILSAMSVMPISTAHAATFTDWSNANRITVQETRTNIYIDATVPNPAGCSLTDYISIEGSQPNFDAMTAAMMTAVAGQYEVRMQIDESNCEGSRPKVVFVSFRN